MYRFVLRSFINAVSAALVLGVLLGGGLLLRLAWGPISLDILAPRVAGAINERLADEAPGWTVDIAGGAVRFDRESARLRLLLTDVALRSPGGGVAARAPAVGFRISPWKAIQGDVELNSIELIGARAVVRRTPEGRVRLAVLDIDQAARAVADQKLDAEAGEAKRTPQKDYGPDSSTSVDGQEDAFAAVAEMIDGLTRKSGGPEIVRDLESVVISNLDLRYEDALSGANWTSSGATLTFERGEDGVRSRLEADVETGGDWPPVSIELTGARAQGSAVVDVVADIRGASPALIASQIQELAALERIHAPVEGRLRSRIGLAEGQLDGVSASLTFGAGFLERTESGPLAFDHAKLTIAYEGGAEGGVGSALEKLTLQQASFSANGLEAEARGELTFGEQGVIDGVLTVGSARISNPEFVVHPIKISGGQAAFRFEPDSEAGTAKVMVDEIALQLEQTLLTGTADAAIKGSELAELDFALNLDGFSAPDLARLWVTGLAPGAQLWIEENIIGGRISQLDAIGRLTRDPVSGALDAEALDVDFTFSDLAGTYLDDMTAIRNGYGNGHLDLQSFSLSIDSASVDLGRVGELDLSGSVFRIPDINADPTPSTISVKAKGPTAALLTLIDQEPLGFISRIGLDPAAVGGTVASTTELSLPLLRDLPLEDVAARASAGLKNLSLRPSGADVDVRFREAELSADTSVLTLGGNARIDGVPLAVEWREVFSPRAGQARSSVSFSGRLDAATLAAQGVPVDQLEMDGRTRVSGTIELENERAPAISLNANLKGMRMALPGIGWRKPKDADGALSLRGDLRQSGARFDRFSLEGAGLAASGALELTAAGGLKQLSLASLDLGRTHVAATIEASGPNALAVTVSGDALDLGPILDAQNVARGEGGDMRFDIQVGSLYLLPSLALTGASIDGVSDAAGLRAEIVGNLGRGKTRLTLAPAGDDLTFEATNSNAGDAMRELGFVEDAHGGTITANGRIEAGGRATGSITIKSIVVKNAPVLAEILSIGTVFGAFDKLATGGISFDTVDGDFVVDPKRVRILEAAAAGPSLGMSLDGAIDRESGALDLAGSVSPAFILNGIFSGVPLIGDILTGGDGQGIVGFAYRVSGTKEKPSVSVNPLSALTPGPFRRIFTDTDAARQDRAAERDAAGPPRVQSGPTDLR